MNIRNKQPRPARNQPVRLYKIIALTFLVVAIVLFGLVIVLSSKRVTINIVSTTTPIDIKTKVNVNDSGAPGTIQGKLEISVLGTTQLFEPSGTRQEDGIASGKVSIRNTRNVSQSLVATTRLMTSDGLLFRLKDKTTVPAGGSVEAEVYADKTGVSGNIGPTRFTIPGLSAELQSEVYAESKESMMGGVKNVGVISDSDMEKAKKIILQRLIERGRVEMGNKYSNFEVLFSSSGDIYKVSNDVGSEVNQFSVSATTTVVGIFYDKQKVREVAVGLLNEKVADTNETVKPGDVEPTVLLISYDDKSGASVVEVVYSGVATLNIDSPELAKEAFYGKTKEEVRRQLLKLDHVKSVEVLFSPSWVRKVPHIEDHVTVVVKSS